ncbi:MAG TPA: Xaa-Pro peptidase family protein [Candidatus Dormibacteraeota bacterium]|nr:Xaa-Pro peptidase family protein [Candidatus Dormibacteraeota bacterium]
MRADLGTFAHGQFRTDYEDRPDPQALRERRVERAREAMARQGLDALLCWKDENVRYLTGLRAQIIAGKSALLNGCLLIPDRSPILLASGGEVQRAKVVMPWLEEIHMVPIMEARGLVRGAVEHTLRPILERHGLTRGRLGLDESGYCLVQALQELLPDLELCDGDAAMQAARLVKLPEEIALMEEASAIAEAVTQAAIDAVAPGVRETDVVAEAMRTLFRLGGEYAHVMTPFVASGEHMSPPNRIASDKIIREGDLVFIDIGAQWGGYFSDIGRTVICGRPHRRQQEVYTAVHEALQEATRAMVPGNTNDDVAAAVRQAAARHGLAGNFISLFIGHGVGMGSNEPPYIGEDLPGAETVVLQEGMTFAVEPLIWVPNVRGGGGVRLEDTILVSPGGGRPLTRLGFDERLLI